MKLQTISKRLDKLPRYLFAELDAKKAELIKNGVNVINLGIGDPDLPPPPRLIEALKKALDVNEFHHYPSYNGAEFLRTAIADRLKKEYNISVDYNSELLVLIGAKEGLSHFPQAVLNQGDSVLITDPCYPPHLQSMLIAGAEPVRIELKEENQFLPDLSSIPAKTWDRAKMIVLNYPNNPTSATATEKFFGEIIDLAHKHNFIICHDSAYIDICLNGNKQPALLSMPGAKDVAIEFFTFSKMFNICGWRLGFCAGNKELIASLGKYKEAVDSGQFTALQKAVAVGLAECNKDIKNLLAVYNERKNILTTGLKEIGLDYFNSGSTFYVWSHTPANMNSEKYANLLLETAGIVATPGIGFGKMGDDYIRFSLTAPTEQIIMATERLKKTIS